MNRTRLWRVASVRIAPACLLFLASGAMLAGQQQAQPAAPAKPASSQADRLQFEVASVREDMSPKYTEPPFSLDSDDAFKSTGSLFEVTSNLRTYIAFAYKLNQLNPMFEGLPQWASTKKFAIHARAAGSPTKDQLRQMMQALLKDRFKLAIHFETREMPVFAMTLIKPGKTGDGLRLHADGPGCDVRLPNPGPDSPEASMDMLPCSTYTALTKPDHSLIMGSRNTTLSQIAVAFSNIGGYGRPVVDQTGITGAVDFAVRFTPDPQSPLVHGDAAPAEFQGESLTQAIKEQLGMKLTPVKAQVSIPVVERVEMPTDN